MGIVWVDEFPPGVFCVGDEPAHIEGVLALRDALAQEHRVNLIASHWHDRGEDIDAVWRGYSVCSLGVTMLLGYANVDGPGDPVLPYPPDPDHADPMWATVACVQAARFRDSPLHIVWRSSLTPGAPRPEPQIIGLSQDYTDGDLQLVGRAKGLLVQAGKRPPVPHGNLAWKSASQWRSAVQVALRRISGGKDFRARLINRARLAKELGISRDTLYEYQRRYPDVDIEAEMAAYAVGRNRTH